MKKLVAWVACLSMFFGAALFAQDPKDITGSWQGTLHSAQKESRVVWTIVREDGRWKTTMYDIDQGGQGFKSSAMTVDGSALKVSFDAVAGEFEGRLAADGSSVMGTWVQGPNPQDLVMVRATKETTWEIPAPPAPVKMMAADAGPAFEVATIKPDETGEMTLQALRMKWRGFEGIAASVEDLIAFAYDLQGKQIIGGPDWIRTARYDIAAVPDQEGVPSLRQMKVMLRKLLTERFQLGFHHDTRELSAFVLTVAKDGQKLMPTQAQGPGPSFGQGPGEGGVTFHGSYITMDEFVSFLQSGVLDRPVVNQTKLPGRFDFNVLFAPDESHFSGHPPKLAAQRDAAEAAPTLFDAMQQQLGLRLDAKKTQVDVTAIDKVQKPSAN